MNASLFLIETLFGLYLTVVILRFWLQMAQADFHNPLSQFVVRATHPVVGPLRRLIPPIGSIDTATLLLGYALCVLKFVLLLGIKTQWAQFFDPSLLFFGALTLLKEFGMLLFWILIIRAVMSWVSPGYNPVSLVFEQLTAPFLNPLRRILPDTGVIDLSVLVLFILLQFTNFLLGDFFGPVWHQL